MPIKVSHVSLPDSVALLTLFPLYRMLVKIDTKEKKKKHIFKDTFNSRSVSASFQFTATMQPGN